MRQGFDQVDFPALYGGNLLILAGSGLFFRFRARGRCSGSFPTARAPSRVRERLGAASRCTGRPCHLGGGPPDGLRLCGRTLRPDASGGKKRRRCVRRELSALLPGKADETGGRCCGRSWVYVPKTGRRFLSGGAEGSGGEIFRPAYADRMEPTAEGFLVTGGSDHDDRMHPLPGNDRLLVLADSGAWHAKREILELAQGASVLLHPQGWTSTARADERALTPMPNISICRSLSGAPSARSGTGVAAARHAGELLSVRRDRVHRHGKRPLTAPSVQRLLPGVTSVRAEGGFLDGARGHKGEGTAYRRTDVIQGLCRRFRSKRCEATSPCWKEKGDTSYGV